MQIRQIFRPERATRGDTNVTVQQPIDNAAWIWRKDADRWGAAEFADTRPSPESLRQSPQLFLRFRCNFALKKSSDSLVLDVSADERYILLLDGKEISRGPHRGLPNLWHYETWQIDELSLGMHRLEAVCWQIGPHAPLAQLSIRGGFILKASGEYDSVLSTGKGQWRVAPLTGTSMTDKGNSGTFGVGSECEVLGTSIIEEIPNDNAWEMPVVVRGPIDTWAGLKVQGWMLFPTQLPEMMRERKSPGRFVGDAEVEFPLHLPAHTHIELLWNLENYFCAYPELRVSGGKAAKIRWDWAECLVGADNHKRDRSAWQGLSMGKCFGDTFTADGRVNAHFTTPWWRCGRWCRIVIDTGDEPIDIERPAIVETRLPASLEAKFDSTSCIPNENMTENSGINLAALQAVCERSLQMCMHEMFFDCPFYEQQMYPGDSRVQYLVATLFGETGRVAVRNAISLYDADRRENGMMPMNCPTRGTQESFPFTCCQAMMLGDLAWNHNDPGTVRQRFPGLMHTLLGMEAYLGDNGLLGRTPGWNFIDWVKEWPSGVPPDGDSERPNAEINLEYLHAIISGERTAEALEEKDLAAFWHARASRLRTAIRNAFWCPEKALFASDVAHTAFSQHSQVLALLADVLPSNEAKKCFDALCREFDSLSRGSIYMRHYIFAAYFKFHRPDLFFRGLDFWRECIGDWHCSTVPEIPDPDSRSDCHGWGSHPLWHLHTGVAGVRSAAPFYSRVLVEPQPCDLRSVRSTTPTPRGNVILDLAFDGNRVTGTVSLPPGLQGIFRWCGQDTALQSGVNKI